jgi:hypothetical protein
MRPRALPLAIASLLLAACGGAEFQTELFDNNDASAGDVADVPQGVADAGGDASPAPGDDGSRGGVEAAAGDGSPLVHLCCDDNRDPPYPGCDKLPSFLCEDDAGDFVTCTQVDVCPIGASCSYQYLDEAGAQVIVMGGHVRTCP